MKLCTRATSALSTRRKGTLFHYYMMYLFLSSVLMTTAGLCLHSILKADRVDSQVADYLQSLGRLELAFRDDVAQYSASAQDSGIQFTTADSHTTVDWKFNANVLKRESVKGAEVDATERFVFPRNTKIEMDIKGKFVVCRLTEPSAMPKEYKVAPSQAKIVEIVATRRFDFLTSGTTKSNAAKEAVSDESNPEESPDAANRKQDGDDQ